MCGVSAYGIMHAQWTHMVEMCENSTPSLCEWSQCCTGSHASLLPLLGIHCGKDWLLLGVVLLSEGLEFQVQVVVQLPHVLFKLL